MEKQKKKEDEVEFYTNLEFRAAGEKRRREALVEVNKKKMKPEIINLLRNTIFVGMKVDVNNGTKEEGIRVSTSSQATLINPIQLSICAHGKSQFATSTFAVLVNQQVLIRKMADKQIFDETYAASLVSKLNVPNLTPIDFLAYALICCDMLSDIKLSYQADWWLNPAAPNDCPISYNTTNERRQQQVEKLDAAAQKLKEETGWNGETPEFIIPEGFENEFTKKQQYIAVSAPLRIIDEREDDSDDDNDDDDEDKREGEDDDNDKKRKNEDTSEDERETKRNKVDDNNDDPWDIIAQLRAELAEEKQKNEKLEKENERLRNLASN